MIKKIIACLTICFIITGIISPVFSDASALPQPNWNDPGISEIINISDLTGWMLNGGTYDVSTYTDADSFMNDYFAARTKTRLEGSDYQIKSSFGLEQQYYQAGDSAYAHPLDVNRVISSSFRDHSGYGRRLSNEVNNALLSSGSLYDTKIPLLNELEFANFVGYNHEALKLYSNYFNNSDDSPSTNIDPEFSFISNINTLIVKGYNGKPNKNLFDFTKENSYRRGFSPFGAVTPVYDFKDCTFMYPDFTGHRYDDSSLSSNALEVTCYYPSLTINVDTSNENEILVSYSNNSGFDLFNLGNIRNNFNYGSITQYPDSVAVGVGNWTIYPYTETTSFASKTLAFNYLFQHFANINLYVDGVAWVLIDENNSNNIAPEFPDTVGGEDLPSTTWPIFRPRAPYYTNVPGVLQAIEDAIADDGKLDIDDLKPYLTDANGDPVSDPIFDPEPVPIPVPDPVNPDVVPGLPILPAIPPDMPGFNGVSVLAEIINFTNQSLPTSLIVTFWGIVFGIVILGLIKILHK